MFLNNFIRFPDYSNGYLNILQTKICLHLVGIIIVYGYASIGLNYIQLYIYKIFIVY